jgi:hypothetical protein
MHSRAREESIKLIAVTLNALAILHAAAHFVLGFLPKSEADE